MFGSDRRVVILALARLNDAIANSFLIIVLPLYIASGEIALPGFEGVTFLGIPITVELLIGIALSSFGIVNSVAQPFTGRLSDITAKRKVYIIFGLGVLALTSLAYALVSSYEALVVVRMVQGIGGAFIIPTTVALVNNLSLSDSERGGNFGVFNTFRLAGYGFGPVVAGIVIQKGPYTLPTGATLSGFDAAFGAAILGALLSLMLVWLFVEEPSISKADASENLSIAIFGDEAGQLFDPVFVLGLVSFIMIVSVSLFATLQGPINSQLNQGSTWFGVQFAAGVAGNILFQMPIGRAADRIGRRPFLLWGTLLLIPVVFVQGFVTSPWTMFGARLVQGVAAAMVFAPSLAVAGDLAAEGESGTTMSVLTMSFGLGSAGGPLVSGLLFGYGLVVPFVATSALAAVGFVLVVTQVDETLQNPSPVNIVSDVSD